MLLVSLESPWQLGFNEGDLELFRPKLGEILNFKKYLSLEIQLNY
jgi:hypothetical protein